MEWNCVIGKITLERKNDKWNEWMEKKKKKKKIQIKYKKVNK